MQNENKQRGLILDIFARFVQQQKDKKRAITFQRHSNNSLPNDRVIAQQPQTQIDIPVIDQPVPPVVRCNNPYAAVVVAENQRDRDIEYQQPRRLREPILGYWY